MTRKRTKPLFSEPPEREESAEERARRIQRHRVESKRRWENLGQQLLVGRTIVAVKWLSDVERDRRAWQCCCPVLVLDDGTQVLPFADDEGNEAGTLRVYKENGDSETLPHI